VAGLRFHHDADLRCYGCGQFGVDRWALAGSLDSPAQISLRAEGNLPRLFRRFQANAAASFSLDQLDAVHRFELPIADLDDMEKDIVGTGLAGGHLHTPPAHHGQILGLKPVVDDAPILSGGPELLAGPSHGREPGIGRQQRASEHPAFAMVDADRLPGDYRLVGRVQEPLLAICGIGGGDAVEDDEVVGHEEHKLPGRQAALFAQFGLAFPLDDAVLVAGRGVAGDVDEIVVRLESLHHGAELPVLAAVVLLDRAAPVPGGRLARLVDDDAIVGDRLGVVVGQVEAVLDLFVARARVESQEAAVVDDEVQGVEMAVLPEDAAAGEQAIGVGRARAGSHEDLAHGVELPCVRETLRRERLRGIVEPVRRNG